ncbi:hypothetical protein F4780DRAFT_705577 [Xylariomycetidae sp. FL0641]|nr:hypothetical protein F4780DRAFT_705577 [Xylariomycetidae sp. FL0641]
MHLPLNSALLPVVSWLWKCFPFNWAFRLKALHRQHNIHSRRCLQIHPPTNNSTFLPYISTIYSEPFVYTHHSIFGTYIHPVCRGPRRRSRRRWRGWGVRRPPAQQRWRWPPERGSAQEEEEEEQETARTRAGAGASPARRRRRPGRQRPRSRQCQRSRSRQRQCSRSRQQQCSRSPHSRLRALITATTTLRSRQRQRSRSPHSRLRAPVSGNGNGNDNSPGPNSNGNDPGHETSYKPS